MYSVIGPDGHVYGPVDGATLKIWCQEGRIMPDTQIVDPIDGNTKAASSIPEIAQYLPVVGPPLPPAAPGQQPGYGYATPPSPNPMSTFNWSQPPTPYGAHPDYRNAIAFGPPRNKVLAIVFALLLGVFGVHRFYLGKTGSGLAMLLITVLSCGYLSPVTFIWSIVDLILIATGGMLDGAERPLV